MNERVFPTQHRLVLMAIEIIFLPEIVEIDTPNNLRKNEKKVGGDEVTSTQPWYFNILLIVLINNSKSG